MSGSTASRRWTTAVVQAPRNKAMTQRKSKNHRGRQRVKTFKIVVEKHTDGYVAYPLGVKGIVVGEGATCEEAMADVKSAIRFHIDTFGPEVLDVDSPVLEAFLAETEVPA
jgi:predicted RNase H-like HicB family nuclease